MKQKKPNLLLKRTLACALIGAQLAPAAWATDIADAPLMTSNQAKPNIMFMLDNSGSMSNIVPESTSGFNASTVYLSSCPAANLVAAGTSVDLVISSGAPRIKIGSTNYVFGTGSGQRCFATNSIYGGRLYINPPFLDSDYTGNYLNWYFGTSGSGWSGAVDRRPGTRNRMEIAKDAAKGVIDSLVDVRSGLATYNGSASGGTLMREIKDLDTAWQTSIKSSIDSLVPTGNTPLAETLSDIGRYFTTGYTGNLTLHPGAGNQATQSIANVFNSHSITLGSGASITANPVQYSCQLNFAVLLTDGRPQADQDISNYLWDYTGDCAAGLCLSTAKTGYGKKAAPSSYESAGSDFLDDVSNALYDMDLRPDLPDSTGRVKKRNLSTYAIGFADYQAQNDPLLRSAATRAGGQFYTPSDAAELSQAFDDILVDIYAKDRSSAAIAVSNVNVKSGDNTSFATSFRSGTWSGDLIATPIDLTTGLPQATMLWSAADKLDALTNPVAQRKIATYSGSAGIQFQPTTASTATKLSSTQQTMLNTPTKTDGADVLAFIRGDKTRETTIPATMTTAAIPAVYRNRTSLMGDTVNAEPVYVRKPMVKWFGETGFSAHIATGSVADTRPGMVYQGANDGMLHAFDAATGEEKWAYVPSFVLPTLNKLSKRVAFQHSYYVDGTPTASEVSDGSGNWKTILVGGLGKGGRGFYALDITNPVANTEADVAAKVLWEFPNSATSAYAANVGFSFSQPIITKTRSGQWVVLVTSGYNNGTDTGGDGKGHLFVLNALTGAVIADITAASGTDNTDDGTSASPSGLAQLTAFVRNYERNPVLDYVYGGDLKGNVWRFDLTATTVSGWKMLKLAKLVDASGNFQPITTAPELTVVKGKPLVAIGTGQYLGKSDIVGTGTTPNTHASQTQSMYALWDDLTTTPRIDKSGASVRTKLLERSVQGTATQRTITPKSPDTTATSPYDYDPATNPTGKRGWFFNFIGSGERLAVNPQLALGTLVFPSTKPSGVICTAGGDTWLYQVDVETGLTSTETSAPKVEFIGSTLATRATFISLRPGELQAVFSFSDAVTPPGSTVVTSVPMVPATVASNGTTVSPGTPGIVVQSTGRVTTTTLTFPDPKDPTQSTSLVSGKSNVNNSKGAGAIERRSWREMPR